MVDFEELTHSRVIHQFRVAYYTSQKPGEITLSIMQVFLLIAGFFGNWVQRRNETLAEAEQKYISKSVKISLKALDRPILLLNAFHDLLSIDIEHKVLRLEHKVVSLLFYLTTRDRHSQACMAFACATVCMNDVSFDSASLIQSNFGLHHSFCREGQGKSLMLQLSLVLADFRRDNTLVDGFNSSLTFLAMTQIVDLISIF